VVVSLGLIAISAILDFDIRGGCSWQWRVRCRGRCYAEKAEVCTLPNLVRLPKLDKTEKKLSSPTPRGQMLTAD